ncbi:hypothetical protein DFH07DRAFT_796957 [Mycena maculata]|uniref:PPPDE domain-containing protein n=1 Tax=Mycena maculata TaxID=230809 RepID=A0AAD7K8P0_9AGAR|nr:hypothetical protein DFH07DRAFT_796957 [Mycena maculata]
MTDAENPADNDHESQSRRQKVKGLIKDEFLKGKLKLEHSLGLGNKPNAIPPADPDIKGPQRTVHLGWHPVAGFAGKWFAEKTGLGKLITAKTHRCPDPTQHWAVLVGEYVHELWMDEHLDVIYINEKVKPEEWHTFEVGKTRFNDEALRNAGEMAIFSMRQKQPGYNLISNNCQIFALQLLDAIQVGKHREFATSFAVYQEAIKSPSKVVAFFKTQAEELPDGETEQQAGATTEGASTSGRPPSEVSAHAVQVMEQNTTHVDDHHSFWRE